MAYLAILSVLHKHLHVALAHACEATADVSQMVVLKVITWKFFSPDVYKGFLHRWKKHNHSKQKTRLVFVEKTNL